jgi:aminopeptidase N
MQKLLFTSCLICFFIVINAQKGIDVLHYKYGIELNDRNDSIYGKAEITLLVPAHTFNIEFDLMPLNSKGRGMIVDTVKSTSYGSTIILPRFSVIKPATIFKHSDDKLLLIYGPDRIDNARANRKDTFIITIYYHGIPSDGLIISKNKYGERTFFADNWPNRAHNWIPCNDDPIDKASFEFIVTAPSHYGIISNGIEVEEKDLPGNKKLTHWKEDIPLPTKVMVIGAADFSVKKYPDSPPDIPVTAWVFARDSINGFKDYDPAPSILKFFSGYIAPYPYKKLANVQSKTIFGGMENASAIFYSENSVTGRHDQESLLAHEIAHQWFGDMATEKNFSHLWLSEGFATYLAHIYIESKYGTDSLNKEMQNDREEVIQFVKTSSNPVVDSVSPYLQLLNNNSYQKGSWILHMLRRQLGDSVFHQIIRSYYDAYKGKNADTKDFKNIAEKISGKNLDIFFSQWLYTPDLPHLAISWKYFSKEKKIEITIEQTQKNSVFQFPLQIAIISEKTKKSLEKLSVTKIKETFILQAREKPIQLVADPDTSLLYTGVIKELK